MTSTTQSHGNAIRCQKCRGNGTQTEVYIFGSDGRSTIRPARNCDWCEGSGITNPGGKGYDYHLAKCERANTTPDWV